MVQKLISGGQTGADRAALDFAIQNSIPHGGYCPRGRKAEDGAIPSKYKLTETKSADYPERTELNVRESDATVIITRSAKLSRGSRLTANLAERHRRPYLHLHSGLPAETAGELLREFLARHTPKTLNVAGSRARGTTTIYDFTTAILSDNFPVFIAK